ncbi:MAG: hypothetical protein ACRETM_07570 [Stenotrophobium sp.]
MLDPTSAISASNPRLADSGLPSQNPCNNGACGNGDNSHQSASFFAATVSPATGAATNIHPALLAYVKGGKIFTLNLTSNSSTPTQVSSVSTACGFSKDDLSDKANPGNSWLEVGLSGSDATCFTDDDTRVLVHLSQSAASAPVTIAGLQGAVTAYSSDGSIASFLDGVASGNNLLLEHRDSSFANPSTLLTAAPDNVQVDHVGTHLIYVQAVPSGMATASLFRYDVSGGTLSPALYTFVNNPQGSNATDSADATNFYFYDGGSVLAIPRSATTSGHTTVLTTLASGLSVSDLEAVGDRIVITAVPSSGNSDSGSGVYSVSTSANGDTATPLLAATGAPSTGNFSFATLIAADPSGLVYINGQTFSTTAAPVSTALRVNADGSSPSSTSNAQWAGAVDGTSIANVNNGDLDKAINPVAVLLDTLSNIVVSDGPTTATHTLSSVTSSTDAALQSLGSIDNGEFVFGGGLTPYAAILAQTSNGQFAYIADVNTASSLVQVDTHSPDTYVGN